MPLSSGNATVSVVANETQMRNRVQFDRVGPYERDWVWLRCHSLFGNATVSIVANETQMRNRVQFDRVGPFERSWVWLRYHSLLEVPPFPS